MRVTKNLSVAALKALNPKTVIAHLPWSHGGKQTDQIINGKEYAITGLNGNCVCVINEHGKPHLLDVNAVVSELNCKEVTVVEDGDWDRVRKAPNESGSPIKDVSMVGGRDGADYEILYNDKTSKLFKFA